MNFALGQRWISDTESDLGLGTIVALEGRHLTLLFPASGETRLYAQAEAPLTRVQFNIGDEVASADGYTLQISAIKTLHDTLVYCGTRLDDQSYVELRETFLDHFISFNQPQDRLFAGQIDRFDWFTLRYQAWQHLHQQQQNPLRGLSGPRVSLIPHQLHIANEVAQRHAPRVLLADEVGLGKTIEAGFIIHQQLISGLASRVLIIVPDSLQHQWLVEMLRRFNLHFSVFDQERCEQSLLDNPNPFDTEQLILCSLSFLKNQPRWHQMAVESQWDLLVVDEAHHLQWSETAPSEEYQRVSALAANTAGLILLTATPDQLGHESHFARLKLLDPARFHSYDVFLKEEQDYQHIAKVAKPLLEQRSLTAEEAGALRSVLAETDISQLLALVTKAQTEPEQHAQACQQLLSQLLDRHGTGRILFRNSRASVKGFPQRCANMIPLALPDQYQNALKVHFSLNPGLSELERVTANLFPEQVLQQLDASSTWWQFDPRVDELLALLKAHKHDKFLLICARAETAIALEEAVRLREGIRAAVFHEGMTIVERDKAAAYFAQEEYSAQLLLCSEIGSEGRNFQFAHHLVLFDLPLNPDLLEQRIGRLDRIGQREDIQLHLPFFADHSQQILLDWYQQGLNALEQTCQTGRSAYEHFANQLLPLLAEPKVDSLAVTALISQTQQWNLALKQTLEQGRDQLLEINSGGGLAAHTLAESLAAQDDDTALPMFMFKAWDMLGINQEDRSDTSIILTHSEHMHCASYPGLGDDGVTVTFDRSTALAEEDVQLLSWDHPMVRGTLDILTTEPHGSSSVAILANKALPVGSYLLEFNFIVEASAPPALQLNRYLPATPLRLLMDKNGNNLSGNVSFEQLNKQLKPIGRQTASKLAGALQTLVHPLIAKATSIAEAQVDAIRLSADQRAQQVLQEQQQRLVALRQYNPSVREDEITLLESQQQQLTHYIAKARLKLDALRLIVVSHD
ncbi:RNA polymerase-associated protein RapA [Rheinheimera baltica]|uniref:RNA polymerase-associated protein RapA n=1 Tax=Rheinheimera baltica TaxID=67576 RepID=UPI00273D8A15|nr:RNA polymerase-associated protein RapA [Rheinheimera baltica]MDP5142528.1 RNA polymerase-associated protein RapA [Rheinheimera baltica]MDP5150401.1 RNA polymerase-associated protein RapA [Rheinheimera baltica]